MVLILVVVLTLLAGMVALSSDRALTEAQAERDAFEGELDMLSTRDTLLFMLSTQRQTVGGLTVEEYTAPPRVSTDDVGFEAVMPIGTEIRLDGRVYGGLGNARFSFQEDRGLVSVAWPGPELPSAKRGPVVTSISATSMSATVNSRSASNIPRVVASEAGFSRSASSSWETLASPCATRSGRWTP